MKLTYFPMTDPSWDTYTNNPTYEPAIQEQCNDIGTFSPFWDAKLSWFPNAYVYVDSYAIYTDPTRNSGLINAHPEWILVDAKGNKLYIPWGCSNGTCPQYAADIGNPHFQQAMIGQMLCGITPGYAGIWLDDVNMSLAGAVSDGTGTAVDPQDPRTGKPMTQTAWAAYFVQYLTCLHNALKQWGLKLIENSVWYESIQAPAQFATSEFQSFQYGFTDPGLTGGTGQWSLFNFFSAIDTAQAAGSLVIPNNDVAMVEYAYACALMAQSGIAYENATPDKWSAGFTKLTNTDYGTPTGPRNRLNGLWWRTFPTGIVYAVEPGATTVTLALDAPMIDAYSGATVSTVTLAQKQGAVLLHQ